MVFRLTVPQCVCCGMRLRASPANRKDKEKVRVKKKLTKRGAVAGIHLNRYYFHFTWDVVSHLHRDMALCLKEKINQVTPSFSLFLFLSPLMSICFVQLLILETEGLVIRVKKLPKFNPGHHLNHSQSIYPQAIIYA